MQEIHCRKVSEKADLVLSFRRKTRRRRGGILITALTVSVVIALVLAGTALLTLSHLSRAKAESNYANALNIAEAGVNFELSRLNLTPAQPDQLTTSSPNGSTYNFGSGTFRVYVTNRDGSSPWTPGSKLNITSCGTISGISRTIQVGVQPLSNVGTTTPFYTLYSMQADAMNGLVGLLLPGDGITVNGNMGSNGFVTYLGNPKINQGAYTTTFNGPGTGWLLGLNPSGFTSTSNPNPVLWPTVDQIANGKWPSNQYSPGGMAYVATHNDNATATPAIVGNSIVALGSSTIILRGKAGGANYYLETLNVAATSQIIFNNLNGPINVWIGPSGGVSVNVFSGGVASIKMSMDSTKPVRIYDATIGGFVINGNQEFDAGIYAVNGTTSSPPLIDFTGTLPLLSTVVLNGSTNFHGQIVANTIVLNALGGLLTPTSPVTVTGESGSSGQGYFQPVDYYGYETAWHEVNGLNQ